MVCLITVGLLLAGCSSSRGATPAAPPPDRSGDVGLHAIVAVHHLRSALDTIILEYSDEVVLPDRAPEELFSFADAAARTPVRKVTQVYSSDEPAVSDRAKTAPGRFVIVQLSTEGGDAGSVVIQRGGRSVFRTDFSELEIRQNFDALAPDGSLLRATGALPVLQRDDLRWPEFDAFTVDDVLSGATGDIHYSYALPAGYDPDRRYPLMIVAPGYGELLHSLDDDTRGINVFGSRNVVAWTQTSQDMIVASPQLTGWTGTAADQVIELTDHLLATYAVDPARVYALGYSAGGETMSQVLNSRSELFAAYVHVSSRWNGGFDDIVRNRTPVFMFMAQSDGYYGSDQVRADYASLVDSYAAAGLSPSAIENLAVMRIPDDQYFIEQGIDDFHAGGMTASEDEQVIRWVLAQHR